MILDTARNNYKRLTSVRTLLLMDSISLINLLNPLLEESRDCYRGGYDTNNDTNVDFRLSDCASC